MRGAAKSGFCLLATLLAGSLAASAITNEPPMLVLLGATQVTGDGIFLAQLVAEASATALPPVRLFDAPGFGHAMVLTRAQIYEAVQQHAPAIAVTNWGGADRIRVTRRGRPLNEAGLKELLVAQMQREIVAQRGELELRLSRAWTTVEVPDEVLTVKVLDLPTSGVGANFIVRFELLAGSEPVGLWQLPVQAKIWRDVLVAKSALSRGQTLSEADLVRERRDVLTLRDLLPENLGREMSLELLETVPEGAAISARAVRPRPVVRRGQLADALIQDGSMTMSLKVEVLENGAPGQMVRVRNPQSRHEFRGKVQNEQTILVSL